MLAATVIEADVEDDLLELQPPPRPSGVAETDVEVLQARVRELQTQVRQAGGGRAGQAGCCC